MRVVGHVVGVMVVAGGEQVDVVVPDTVLVPVVVERAVLVWLPLFVPSAESEEHFG